ncbi:MAG TPA: copper homeostasis membrane protein CopD [Casimicrobiaceae bacterium]
MTAGSAFAVVRAVHELAALIALGQLVWAEMIRRERDAGVEVLVAVSIGVSLVAALGWLAFEAVDMSGLPFTDALTRSTLAVVLEETLFGRVWALRLVLGAGICAWLVARRRGAGAPGCGERRVLLVFVAVYVATLALTGHAVAAQGAERVLRVGADALHLLAAGAWLGALPGLAGTAAAASGSASPEAIDAAARATRRFSVLGIVCVATLIATGIVNAWFLVGSRLALIGTSYGHWLLAKLALFAAMIAIAAYNRQRLSPRIGAGDRFALGQLARNARVELALGAVIVAIVGHLGISVPAIHDHPVVPAFLAGGAPLPTYPTTDAVSPVPASDDAIAHGRELFVANCAACHGDSGRGDGAKAASLPVAPADLTMHGSMHTPGDLWWKIAHGVPGTPMPAFSPRLRDTEIWQLVQYVRAIAGAPVAARASSSTHAHEHEHRH